MRLACLFLSSCALIAAGTLNDPFNAPQTNCNYSFSAPFSACDVIGAPIDYDIQKISVSATGATAAVTIYFNYGGGMSLQPFTDGIPLQVGDIFFYNPSDAAMRLQYGVDLYGPRPNSQAFVPGALYAIDGTNVSLETADQALNFNTGYYYRRTQDVLMTSTGTPAFADAGNGVSVVRYGDGVTNALYAATVQFAMPAGFAGMLSAGDLGIVFDAADCGNDNLTGIVSTIPDNPTTETSAAPEPGALWSMTLGITLLAGLWWKYGARATAAGDRRVRVAPKNW